MKTNVIIKSGTYDGYTGTVDGYVNMEGKICAIVILDSSHKFVLISICNLMEMYYHLHNRSLSSVGQST